MGAGDYSACAHFTCGFRLAQLHGERKALHLRNKHATDCPTDVLIVVIRARVDIRRIEVQVVGVLCRVGCSRPIVAVRATVVRLRTIPVAREHEDTSKTAPGTYRSTQDLEP